MLTVCRLHCAVALLVCYSNSMLLTLCCSWQQTIFTSLITYSGWMTVTWSNVFVVIVVVYDSLVSANILTLIIVTLTSHSHWHTDSHINAGPSKHQHSSDHRQHPHIILIAYRCQQTHSNTTVTHTSTYTLASALTLTYTSRQKSTYIYFFFFLWMSTVDSIFSIVIFHILYVVIWINIVEILQTPVKIEPSNASSG